jgi:hypothetical protein
MNNKSTQTIALPKSALIKKEGVVVLPLKKWRDIEKENLELRLAIKAIFAGETAFRQKKTRSFREFLKSELS